MQKYTKSESFTNFFNIIANDKRYDVVAAIPHMIFISLQFHGGNALIYNYHACFLYILCLLHNQQ